MRSFAPTLECLESRVAPATFTVRSLADSGTDTLREALAKADAIAGPDKIIFKLPPPAVAHGENIILLSSGELTSKGNITIVGPGFGKLIIDANGTSRVFDISDGDTNVDSPATINGLSIARGKSATFGGGIYSSESLTLKSVVVSGSAASSGGGVAVKGTSTSAVKANISSSRIANNSVTAYGGGLYLENLKAVTISKTTVSGNTAGNSGGGIYAEINGAGTGIAITDCQVSGNKASYGGGIAMNSNSTLATAKASISGTKVIGNTSTSTSSFGGGGIFLTHGNATITGSTIGDNTAVYCGGGVNAMSFASLTISKSTISGNRTTKSSGGYQGGGGIFIQGAGSTTPQPVKITGSTISDNTSADFGGGELVSDGITMTITSSTFARNNAASHGGGLAAFGTGNNKVDLTVSGGTFSDNSTGQSGGGMFASGDGRLSVASSKVTGNVAYFRGGGIYGRSSAATNGVILKNVTVTGNVAGLVGISGGGGGVAIGTSADFHITGGSIVGNQAVFGGGFYELNSTGSILGVTISGNSATVGGGVLGAGPGTVALQIAKVFANTAPSDPNFSGTFTFV
jgi:predicted outer membrane repeat protein